MLTDKELEEIRRKMLELEEEPPAGSWQQIQAEVKPKGGLSTYWWLLSLLLLLLTGVGTYQLIKSDNGEVAVAADQVLQEQAPVPADKLNGSLGQGFAERQKLQQGQAKATVLPKPHNGLNKSDVSASKHSDVQQGPQIAQALTEGQEEKPPLSLESDEGGAPENPLVAILPTSIPVLITVPDSADRTARPMKGVRVIPVEISLLAERPEKPGNVTTAESRVEESSSSEQEAKAQESAKPAEEGAILAAKEEAIPKEAVADSTKTKEDTEPTLKEKKKTGRKEWAAGVYFAPRYSFRKFVPNVSDDILITRVISENQLDPERLGYEFGANYSMKLNSAFVLDAGLSWMQLKENVAYVLTAGVVDSMVTRQEAGGQVVLEPSYRMEERQLISSYSYGGLRLGTTYYFLENSNRRLNLTLAGGANLLIKGTTRQYRNGEWTETVVFPSKENILEQSNYNFQLGVGYNVSLAGNYELTFMPMMSYFLGSTFKEREPLGLKPYSLGMNLQLKRRFSR